MRSPEKCAGKDEVKSLRSKPWFRRNERLPDTAPGIGSLTAAAVKNIYIVEMIVDLSGKFPVLMLGAMEDLSQHLYTLGLYAAACDDEKATALLRDLSDRLESHRYADLFAQPPKPNHLPSSGRPEIGHWE
jgi:hypothetical protein